MCGISGILNFDPADAVDATVVANMTAVLSHRGPDDEGFFVEGQAGLGFRRLSIIDLAGGAQPIFNEDRSAVITFNGEIYNYRDLAEQLQRAGHIFRTRSDTETILHAYEEYGDDCVDHLRGMFAFAIWDRRKQRLLLARDRLGIKPLYFYRDHRFLAFASEIKALLEIPGIPREVDPDAFDQYLTLRYVPGPRTMLRNIVRLQPGHILAADPAGVRIRKYWDVHYPEPEPGSIVPAVERFRDLFEESVRLRLMADVPLGVFLSGGIDSSAILAAASKFSAGRIQTFSVGYQASSQHDEDWNEFEYARLAADAFGAEHHEYRMSVREFEESLPRLVWHLDQPLADPSCIPLYFISKVAREHVTVILSGEGADEILGGYGIYRRMLAMESISRRFSALPRLAPWIARVTPSEVLRNQLRIAGQPLAGRYRGITMGLGRECRDRLVGEDRRKRSDRQLHEIFEQHFLAVKGSSALSRMLYVDAKIWLPDDLLLKADKMTMANGLELRVPFLDHELVEFAAALPDDHKISIEGGKTLLRRAMKGTLPDRILHRPKKGFPVPLASWLRGPLRTFVHENLLSPQSSLGQYVDPASVSRIVEEHEQGRRDRSQEIWTLMTFEFWRRRFISGGLEKRQVA
jgi:asparagine synthase (glutamine-hydrolysing)